MHDNRSERPLGKCPKATISMKHLNISINKITLKTVLVFSINMKVVTRHNLLNYLNLILKDAALCYLMISIDFIICMHL